MGERHKRKEIFSFILVSNMDNRSRQFSISALGLRILICIIVLFFLGVGILVYLYMGRAYDEYQTEKKIQEKQERILELEEENKLLLASEENLHMEINRLQDEMKALKDTETAEEEKEEEGKNGIPKLYPLEQAGELQGTFLKEKPYLTINIQKGNKVIATGDGIVHLVDYDEAYVHSIEIEHTDGYVSRYLCNKDAEVEVTEGETVKARDTLFDITSSNTILHYQIVINNEPINPFQVMKGEE